jgi:hypothetical protein
MHFSQMPISTDSKTFSRTRLTVRINAPTERTESSLSEIASSRPPKSQGTSEHDTTLLIAALEELEYKQLAIESVRDAELLWMCLG